MKEKFYGFMLFLILAMISVIQVSAQIQPYEGDLEDQNSSTITTPSRSGGELSSGNAVIYGTPPSGYDNFQWSGDKSTAPSRGADGGKREADHNTPQQGEPKNIALSDRESLPAQKRVSDAHRIKQTISKKNTDE